MSSGRRYFGTDGIRGKVGSEMINPEFVLKLGWAVGKVFAASAEKGHVLIGKDTRISGYMLESALEAGLSAAGVDITLLGPMPTPAIAYLTRTQRAQAGIVISASHNPYYDNGIKFFSADGTKLSDEIEKEIETLIDEPLVSVESGLLGKAIRLDDAPGRYIEFCKSTIPSVTRLGGTKIVVDCAHGATYHIAPHVFRELGADVVEIGVEPDGFNINSDCGSTKPEKLQSAVLKHHADLGIALDGDGDRLILVDHKGNIVDGDDIIYIIARDLFRRRKLKGGVVGTVMSNLGLEHALEKKGIEFTRTKVGDRYVLAELLQRGWRIGGEPSGHIIHLSAYYTGVGIVAALQVLAAMNQSNKTLSELRSKLVKYPQIIVNVAVKQPKALHKIPEMQSLIKQSQTVLKDEGRVLIRPSGTEPIIRVMVEGTDAGRIETFANDLADDIRLLAQKHDTQLASM